MMKNRVVSVRILYLAGKVSINPENGSVSGTAYYCIIYRKNGSKEYWCGNTYKMDKIIEYCNNNYSSAVSTKVKEYYVKHYSFDTKE